VSLQEEDRSSVQSIREYTRSGGPDARSSCSHPATSYVVDAQPLRTGSLAIALSDMAEHGNLADRQAPSKLAFAKQGKSNPIPSSSPAFGTPAHPLRTQPTKEVPSRATVLPVNLPAATLRPVAFRTFTKKYSLTLTSSALQLLASFIGKHCGSAWRQEGLAEKVLEEAAKRWKKQGGGLIVNGEGKELNGILNELEGYMEGGRITQEPSRSASTVSSDSGYGNLMKARPGMLLRDDSTTSFGMSALEVEDEMEDEHASDPRRWLKVIGAFEQPRLAYNFDKKHFEKISTPPSLLPKASHKTHLFHQRYNLVHQRLLRNESFQGPAIAPSRSRALQRSDSFIPQQAYKLTPIANLLGRDASNHVLLGLLTVTPTGTLALSDMTGSIALDLTNARSIPEKGAQFTPGMIVVVDGIYEEEGTGRDGNLGGGGGVGGTIGGKFVGLSVGGPPCERREATLGVSSGGSQGDMTGGSFGWVDFLGVGSEKTVGSRMRILEKKTLASKGENEVRSKVVILGEVNLDNPRSLQALKRVLGLYMLEASHGLPMTFVFIGNFVSHSVMAGGGSGGSIEYKEYFDSLASAFSEYPQVLQAATFVFVPGDNDPWASAASAGASTPVPRQGVPDLFTSRIKRAFTTANAEAERTPGTDLDGEALWTTNPARISLFGTAQELVLFRDDISGRLRRNAVQIKHVEPDLGNGDVDEADGVIPEEESMDIDEIVADAEAHQPAEATAKQMPSGNDEDIQRARILVKTILDQGYLSPFPLPTRPVLWDYSGALQLYPLPTALVVADPETQPFAITYEGCHVMNPGRMIPEGRKGQVQWLEFDARTRRARTRETTY
jgi:DNA polymerase epsilon subunit 2